MAKREMKTQNVEETIVEQEVVEEATPVVEEKKTEKKGSVVKNDDKKSEEVTIKATSQDNSSNNANINNVKTGDDPYLGLAFLILITSGTVLAISILKQRKSINNTR